MDRLALFKPALTNADHGLLTDLLTSLLSHLAVPIQTPLQPLRTMCGTIRAQLSYISPDG